MSLYRGVYYYPGSCTGSARPGAKALMAWALGAYGARGLRNLGIYNCRNIAGTSALSTHGEGRADDLGAPVGNPWSQGLAQWLVDHSDELGVQLVIHRGRYWTCTQPDAGWLPYKGTNPHNDHIHVELTPFAAATLTVDRINQLAAPAPKPTPAPTPTPTRPTIRRGANGPFVTYLQSRLVSLGYFRGYSPNGNFGPVTDHAVRSFQSAQHIAVDGIVGPITWSRLG